MKSSKVPRNSSKQDSEPPAGARKAAATRSGGAHPTPEPQRAFAELEEKLHYRFQRPELLREALTHRSWRAGLKPGEADIADNERLEFLGDAVLALRTSERLLTRFPESQEGRLSRLRSWIVSARYLADVSQGLDLGRFLLLSRGEESIGGRSKERLLANALEAVVGAVHLDGGYQASSRLIDQHVLGERLETITPEHLHEFAYKSALQEWTHAEGKPLPVYRIQAVSGPEHGKTFTVEVEIPGVCRATAEGHSRKDGEQRAARAALVLLGRVAAEGT